MFKGQQESPVDQLVFFFFIRNIHFQYLMIRFQHNMIHFYLFFLKKRFFLRTYKCLNDRGQKKRNNTHVQLFLFPKSDGSVFAARTLMVHAVKTPAHLFRSTVVFSGFNLSAIYFVVKRKL